jgi:hypothetical protein
VIAVFESLDEARAGADADPYVDAGVYHRVDVRPFRPVLPRRWFRGICASPCCSAASGFPPIPGQARNAKGISVRPPFPAACRCNRLLCRSVIFRLT